MSGPNVGYNGTIGNTFYTISSSLTQALGYTTLATDAVIDTNTITLVGGHPIVTNDYIVIAETLSGSIYMGEALNVVVNDISLDTPINYAFPAATSLVLRTTREMDVDGSTTPQIFSIGPPDSQDWEITRLIFAMLTNGQPDDSKFGDLSSLTKGLVVRLKRNGGERYNLFNIKNQFELREIAYDITYADNAGPLSEWGVSSRLTYGGREKHGQPQILYGQTNDVIEAIIQDDLTGLVNFHMGVGGRVVTSRV